MKKRIILTILLTSFALVGCKGNEDHPKGDGEPHITFDGKKSIVGGRNDAAIELPSFVAVDGEGNPLSNEHIKITHTVDGEDDDKEYKPGLSSGYYSGGEHGFHFVVTDPKTGKTCEDNITFSMYQRILGDGGDTMSDTVAGYGLQNESTNPYYRTTNAGWAVRPFYMQRSFQYYAEATFPGFVGDYRSIGMLHTDKNDINLGSFYRDEIWGNPNSSDGNWGYHGGYMWENLYDNDSSWFNQGPNPLFDTPLDFSTGTIKCACARDGEYFYFFVNDILVTKYTIDIYKDRATIPGFALGTYHEGNNKNRTNAHDIDNIKFYSGLRAMNKLKSLINEDYSTFYYLRYDDEGINNWATFNKDTGRSGMGFKYNEDAVDLKGQFWNDSVAPRIRMSGDFKIEFDYELLGVGNDWGNLRIAIADARDSYNAAKTNIYNVHSGLYLFYNTSLSVQDSTYLTKGGWEENIDDGFNFATLKSKLGLANNKRDSFHISITCKQDFLLNREIFTYEFSKDNKSYVVESIVTDTVIQGVHLLDKIRPYYIYFTVDRLYYRISNFSFNSLSVFD